MATSSKQFKAEEPEVTSVSRSGRLCKKSSKLMYFDSTKNNNNNNKKNKLSSKRYQKLKQSQNIENIDLQNQSQNSYKNYSVFKSPKKSTIQQRDIFPTNQLIENKTKSETSEMSQPSNSETESESSHSNNGLQTPDYTSYDEDSVCSEEELLISKVKVPTPEPKKTFSPNLLIENKMNTITEDSVYTGYKLWSTEMKKEIFKKYPNIDIAIMTVRLGEMWTKLSLNDRNTWHNRAQNLTKKIELFHNNSNIERARQEWLSSNTEVQKFQMHQSSNELKLRTIQLQPIDVAAYLKLLAESLMLIGGRLKQHDKSVVMSDSITVLLDSLLCAMSSLICLTQQISILKINNYTTFLKTLENIAYIMPGL